MSNLKYWLWLTSRVGVSGQGMAELLSHFGTPESAYFADRHAYESVAGLSEKARRSFQDKSLSRVDQILGDCDRLGIRIMTILTPSTRSACGPFTSRPWCSTGRGGTSPWTTRPQWPWWVPGAPPPTACV